MLFWWLARIKFYHKIQLGKHFIRLVMNIWPGVCVCVREWESAYGSAYDTARMVADLMEAIALV